MKLSFFLVAASVAATTVRWANDDELAIMDANRGKVGTALPMPNAVEMQTMEVERMFNITPGHVPIGKMREIWKYHGQNVDEDRLLHWLANSTQQAQGRRGEQQVLAANQFIRAGGFAMFLAYSNPADGFSTIRDVWNDCYGAATKDGTATGKECGDKVIAAIMKGCYAFVAGGLGYGAVLLQGQADPNQPVYELQNQLPPDLEHGARKRSADQACPNHNGNFNGFFGVRFHLGPHIGAKLSGYAACGTGGRKPDDNAQGSFGYQINRLAGDNGAARIQFYTIQDGSRSNIMGGAIVYETNPTDTCPEYIGFNGCEE